MALADPTEDLATPTLPQVLQLAIENRLEDVHTFSWGVVLVYNSTAQTANVQIIPRRHYTDEDGHSQSERPSPLLNVPVQFPGSGAFSITWPVHPGDIVLLAFTETALDAFMTTGQTDVDSGDDRKHHITDAVAIPGLRPRTAPVPPTGVDGSALVIAAPTIKLGDSTASAPVQCTTDGSDFKAALAAAILTAPTSGVAALTALQTQLNALPVTGTGTHAGASWPVGSPGVKVK